MRWCKRMGCIDSKLQNTMYFPIHDYKIIWIICMPGWACMWTVGFKITWMQSEYKEDIKIVHSLGSEFLMNRVFPSGRKKMRRGCPPFTQTAVTRRRWDGIFWCAKTWLQKRKNNFKNDFPKCPLNETLGNFCDVSKRKREGKSKTRPKIKVYTWDGWREFFILKDQAQQDAAGETQLSA